MPSASALSSVPDLEKIGIKAAPPLAENFRIELAGLLGRGDNTTFPGAQPISFARQHLEELTRRDYYVCEKSDGIRCLLYFTTDHRGVEEEDEDGNVKVHLEEVEIHYLIDRKNDYYFVQGLHFPLPAAANPPGSKDPPQEINWASYHKETLLDGELLYDTYPSDGHRVLKYLVFDCLFMDGQNMMSRTLDKRLAYFMERIHAPYAALCKTFPVDAAEFPFQLEKKSFQLSYGMMAMFKDITPKLMHGNDGLIFTCRETPYKFGTDEHILKWKPAEENTIDFKLELTFPPMPQEVDDDDDSHAPQNGDDASGSGNRQGWQYDYDAHPTLTLYEHVSEREDHPLFELHATPDEWAHMKSYSIARNDGLDCAIVECHREASSGRWRFNRFREDKREANHRSTVEKVLQSIEDGVTEEELIGAAGSIRTAWKRRAAEGEERERARRAKAAEAAVAKRKAEGEREGEVVKRVRQEGGVVVNVEAAASS